MNGPHGGAPPPDASSHTTVFGYQPFRCSACPSRFNARPGPPFHNLPFPTAVVLLVVRWRLRDPLRRRDVAALFLVRGFAFTPEPARAGAARVVPLMTAP
jgi:hypothetical protein